MRQPTKKAETKAQSVQGLGGTRRILTTAGKHCEKSTTAYMTPAQAMSVFHNSWTMRTNERTNEPVRRCNTRRTSSQAHKAYFHHHRPGVPAFFLFFDLGCTKSSADAGRRVSALFEAELAPSRKPFFSRFMSSPLLEAPAVSPSPPVLPNRRFLAITPPKKGARGCKTSWNCWIIGAMVECSRTLEQFSRESVLELM